MNDSELDLYWVYCTAGDLDEARTIAATVVRERLAACVNILGAIESHYWWDGAVQSGSEVALVAKTASDRLESLTARIVQLHAYDCPAVVALPIREGYPAFLEWIFAETRQGETTS